MKGLIRWKLHMLARWCVRRHKPFVIGVTGSFGKTTARNIIAEILRQAGKDVYTPEGNYNGEWGLAMAILQVRSPGQGKRGKACLFRSKLHSSLRVLTHTLRFGTRFSQKILRLCTFPFELLGKVFGILFLSFGWIGVFLRGTMTLLRKKYPSILVLEYGIDHIGEMELQTRIVEPDIALFTTLAPAHLIGFSSEEAYFLEKGKLLSRKTKNTHAIGNADDPYQKNFSCNVWYGKNAESDCVFTNIIESIEGIKGIITNYELRITNGNNGAELPLGSTVGERRGLGGVEKLRIENGKFTLSSPILGAHHMGLLVGAFLVAKKMKIPTEDILEYLKNIHLPNGRGNVLRGIRESFIIDGTYNGGFAPIVAGAKMLVELARQEQRKTIVLIGDMRELGPIEKIRHEELWKNISSLPIDYFIFVGKICEEIIRPLAQDDAKTNTFFTRDAREAGKYMQKILENDSEKFCIFAKGSQNTIYLEEGLKYIVIPEEISQLVRQDTNYLRKKEQFFRENFGK